MVRQYNNHQKSWQKYLVVRHSYIFVGLWVENGWAGQSLSLFYCPAAQRFLVWHLSEQDKTQDSLITAAGENISVKTRPGTGKCTHVSKAFRGNIHSSIRPRDPHWLCVADVRLAKHRPHWGESTYCSMVDTKHRRKLRFKLQDAPLCEMVSTS